MTIEEQNRKKLREELKDIYINADEQHTLDWLARMEAYSVDNIISLMEKIRRAERGSHE